MSVLIDSYMILTSACDYFRLLHGERPYWWVHETSLYQVAPTIHQYSLTCETGPGTESLHAYHVYMSLSKILCVLLTALIEVNLLTESDLIFQFRLDICYTNP